MLCCGYTLTDFPISIRLTSLALWQSNDCPSASKATLMNMDKYFMWIHYERLHNHNKAKHNKTVCIFLGIYCISHWNTDPWNNRKNGSTAGKVSQSENVMLQDSSYGGGAISVQLISMKLFGLKSRNPHNWSPFKPQLTQMYVFYLRGLVKLWSYVFRKIVFVCVH